MLAIKRVCPRPHRANEENALIIILFNKEKRKLNMSRYSDVVIKLDKSLRADFESVASDFLKNAFDYEDHEQGVVAYRWEGVRWTDIDDDVKNVMAFVVEHGHPDQADPDVPSFGFIRVGEEGEVETYGVTEEIGLMPHLTVLDDDHVSDLAYTHAVKAVSIDVVNEIAEDIDDMDLSDTHDVYGAIERYAQQVADDFMADFMSYAQEIAKARFGIKEDDEPTATPTPDM